MARDLLFEIGTEEIPARFLPAAVENIRSLAAEELAVCRLEVGGLKSYATPRRLTLYISNLAERQQDLVEEIKGPAVASAFSPAGEPTRAALGFARSRGVSLEDLVVREVESGKYVFALRRVSGQETSAVLPALLARLVNRLSFPRLMRWGGQETYFVRPIRWVVALYGQEVVPMEIAGVRSDRVSRGHRFLGSGEVVIDKPRDYLEALRRAFVIADQEERRRLILQGCRLAALSVDGSLKPDEELLSELTYILEFPTAFLGSFPGRYLDLPREVIVTPMREHQRYFPVYNKNGQLLPQFVAVSNGTLDGLEEVRRGNEKVLRARLDDAYFFYREDLRIPFAERVEKLKNIVFQEGLGTLYDKTLRLEALCAYLAEATGLDPSGMGDLCRAAHLAKADLTTGMVYEYPELQGIMGSYYAELAPGGPENPEVCRVIREHYLPRSAEDGLPVGASGAFLSIADKIDTLVGLFTLGLIPTGSQDPYALRRQAHGVVRILVSRGVSLSLGALIAEAARLYALLPGGGLVLSPQTKETLMELIRTRLENILHEEGVSYDVVQSVLSAGYDTPCLAARRARALQAFRRTPEFTSLYTAFTRARNLARGAAQPVDLRTELLTAKAERYLYRVLGEVAEAARPLLKAGNYEEALAVFARLGEPVDRFLQEVLVMVDNQVVRGNRLALLRAVAGLVEQVADLSRLVVPGSQ